MARSKVVFAGTTLIDLTGDTVGADKLLKGVTAHDKQGNAVTGTVEVYTFRTRDVAGQPPNNFGQNGDFCFTPAEE